MHRSTAEQGEIVTLVGPDWLTARRTAYETAPGLGDERVAIGSALGRVTARDSSCLVNMPNVPIAAMDGWAVRGVGPWTVTGELLAGSVLEIDLEPGEAVGIATGARVPRGASAVLRSEDGELAGSQLRGAARTGAHIRPPGEEALLGDVLVPARTRLTPTHLGLLSSAGYDDLDVVRRPRVGVLVLGDELLARGVPHDGLVRDALGPQLPAWLQSWGCDVVRCDHVDDSLHALTAAIEANDDVDLLVSTGGTARGPVDHLHSATDRAGAELLIDSVACRPGHPMMLARHDGQMIVGLPGNPQAAIVGMFTLAQPAVHSMLGTALADLETCVLGAAVGTRGEATRLIPCVRAGHVAHPQSHIGSGMLRGLALADGFAVVEPGCGDQGRTAAWVPLR